jgi:HK97 family phage portal protein
LFEKIKKLFAGNQVDKAISAGEKKDYYPYLQSQIYFLNAAVYSPARYNIFSFEGYMSNPIVYRCVNLIATAVAGIPWKLYKQLDSGKDVEVTKAAVLDLLRQPNPRMGQADFFTELVNYLQVSGNVYVKSVGPNVGPPRELYLLRPDFFNIRDDCNFGCYDEDTRIYEYNCGGTIEQIPARFMWHGRLWNPLCHLYGLSPLQAAWRSIIQLNEALNWNVALLQNAASPTGILTSEGNLTDEQVARLKEQLATKYQSMSNAGRPMVLDGGLEWSQMSLSPKDMDFNTGQKMATKNICLALGVDPVLLGDADNRTYATYKDAEKSFYFATILPNLDRIRDDFLNSWLLPKFPGTEKMYFEYDRDSIEVLSEDRTIIWERALAALKEGLITLNEARESIGYSEFSNEDTRPTSSSSEYEDDVEREKSIKKKELNIKLKSFNLITEVQQKRYIDNVEKLRRSSEIKYIPKAAEILVDEKLDIIEKLDEVKSSGIIPIDINDRLVKVIEPSEWKEFYKDLYYDVIKIFGEKVIAEFRMRIKQDEAEREHNESPWLLLALLYGEEAADIRIDEVVQTSRDRIKTIINQVLADDGSIEEIIAEIEELYDHDIPIRSKLIAETEVVTACNIGMRYTAKSLPILVRKKWIAIMDDRTRESHQRVKGEVQDIDKLYSNGLMFP